MARLHEFQGKAVLKQNGIPVPESLVISKQSASDLESFSSFPAVIKAQAWTTSRFKQGLIQFAENRNDADKIASELFGRIVNNFAIDTILAEEKLDIAQEFFFSYMIDDSLGQPRVIFAGIGGSGIEEILQENPGKMQTIPIDPENFYLHDVTNLVRKTGIEGKLLADTGRLLYKAIRAAIRIEARSLEINPIALTKDGRLVAADCRIAVDDYAVFRHPELGIEIARELSNPPTMLDRVAFDVEKSDYRGTFYFIQMETGFSREDRYIGFHGAGGGGSMMSMDAVLQEGFKIANFCDTSGNPPASKVYRAARIIASQPNIIGYFGSGSGVASQEQVHSARGLVKAFREMEMSLPVVIRLGGNLEDDAVEILENYTRDLPASIRGFKKDDPVTRCAKIFKEMVDEQTETRSLKLGPYQPEWIGSDAVYRFATMTGNVHFNHSVCLNCENHVCVDNCIPQILKLEEGKPVLAIDTEDAAKGKCIECLICEVECQEHALGGGFVELPIPGLDEYLGEVEK